MTGGLGNIGKYIVINDMGTLRNGPNDALSCGFIVLVQLLGNMESLITYVGCYHPSHQVFTSTLRQVRVR